ncbi:hypothetical protein ACQ4LE_006480 [Meloidogyne hapla]
MSEIAYIDEALNEVFIETDLLSFQSTLVFDKQLTRHEHFYDVTDDELKSYGLSEPAIRRLRHAIVKKSKKQSKPLFGGGRKNVKLVQIKRETPSNSSKTQNEGFEFNNTQPFLIAENEISLFETLGEGNFSIVKRAVWTRLDNTKMDCAVKILHNMNEILRKDLSAEITNMQKLRHQNLVQLFGVVFGSNTLMVLEYCQGGSLLDRLKNCGNGKLNNKIRPLITTLHNYTQQIVNGMAYLESRRCVHRDLAARNVLLAHDEQIVKICDFGLARALSENERLYVMNELKKVPFSWCPPESLRYRQFSHKSDVWAFGVTMWELYTFSEEPWAGYRAAEVLQLIESGQILKQPEYCPQQIYEIMKMCWYNEPEQRPKFTHLRKMLLDIKFTHVVCHQSYNNYLSSSQFNSQNDEMSINNKKSTFLHLSQGDHVCLICERKTDFFFGQNVKTRDFGEFPKSICSAVNNENEENNSLTKINVSSSNIKNTTINNITTKLKQKDEISFPVVGSFIHTGHGDIDERQCWGHVDHIEQIYLQNPIIGASNVINNQPPIIVPSLLNLQNPLNIVKNNSKSFTNLVEAKSQKEKDLYRTITTATTKITENNNNKTTSIFDIFDPLKNQLNQNTENLTEINLSIGLRKNSLPSISVIKEQQSQKSSLNSIFLRPPPTTKNGSNGGNATISSSKYDYSMSIPRPNRNSPTNSLTPPNLSRENSTKTTEATKDVVINSLPSSNLDLTKEQLFNLNLNNFIPQPTQRPKSAHFLFDEMKRGNLNASTTMKLSLDDPFTVKDDIKTLLNTKLPYREVHKSSNGGFNSNVAIVHPTIISSTSSVNPPPFKDINGINNGGKCSDNVLQHQEAKAFLSGDLRVALPELNSLQQQQQQPILVNNALIFDGNTKNGLNGFDGNYFKNYSSLQNE